MLLRTITVAMEHLLCKVSIQTQVSVVLVTPNGILTFMLFKPTMSQNFPPIKQNKRLQQTS